MSLLFVCCTAGINLLNVSDYLLGTWRVTGLEVDEEEPALAFFEPRDHGRIALALGGKSYTIAFTGLQRLVLDDLNGRIADINFEQILDNHLSAKGSWRGAGSFAAELITKNTMHLTVFGEAEIKGLSFVRIDTQEEKWYDRYYKLIFSGATFVLAWGVGKLIQKVYRPARKTKEE